MLNRLSNRPIVRKPNYLTGVMSHYAGSIVKAYIFIHSAKSVTNMLLYEMKNRSAIPAIECSDE